MIAIILAGGKGSRLAPWHTAKCLMPINGVPILHRLLKHLNRYVAETIVCIGNHADDVEAALEGINGWSRSIAVKDASVTLVTSNAGEDATMGQRLRAAYAITETYGRKDPLLICYADELADVDIEALLKKHGDGSQYAPPYGSQNAMTFTYAAQRVTGGVFQHLANEQRDNPLDDIWIKDNHTVPVNIGFVVVEPKAWQHLQPEHGLSDWINETQRHMPVGAYEHTGKRATVNSLADLAHAEEVWK